MTSDLKTLTKGVLEARSSWPGLKMLGPLKRRNQCPRIPDPRSEPDTSEVTHVLSPAPPFQLYQFPLLDPGDFNLTADPLQGRCLV